MAFAPRIAAVTLPLLAAAMGLAGCSADVSSSANRVPSSSAPASAGTGAPPPAMSTPAIPMGAVPVGTGKVTPMAGQSGTAVGPISSNEQCVGQTQHAEAVPVDMYLMLDRSASMLEMTGTGQTKWDALRSALASFIADPQSDGLGVGLQYFPLGAPGVPDRCTADADCGLSGGTCLNRACRPPPLATSFSPIPCATDADCPLNSPGCQPLGTCSGNPNLACFNIGPTGCNTDGACQLYPGQCSEFGSCTSSDYATPAVPIAALPGNAMALTSSLMSKVPVGRTPTGAALRGAIDRATMQRQSNPGHQVIAVLATDGLPTQCLSMDVQTDDQAVEEVATVAAEGAARMPSIRTYVIGVFGSMEMDALMKLNRLASAGGTSNAFIVDATGDVASQFLSALATIRTGGLKCEFQLPMAPTGARLDLMRVNVRVTNAGMPRDIPYVQNAARCATSDLGWFYDVDPAQGGTPSQIRTCPSTCTMFSTLKDATIDIQLGCATILQ